MNVIPDSATKPPAPGDSARPTALTEFVRHAAAIGADFTLRVKTADELRAVLVAIGSHNNYNAKKAAALLGPVVPQSMQVSIKQWCGGPALYFQVPYFTHQRIAAQYPNRDDEGHRRYSDDERKAMAQRVRSIGRELRADEITVRQGPRVGVLDEPCWTGTGDNPYEIRLWWD